MSSTSKTLRPRGLQRFTMILIAAALVSAPAATITSAHAAKTPVVTPTSVVASNVTQRSFDVKIGGATIKNYDVYVNGSPRAVNAPSSSSLAINIPYLQPGTTYSIQVAQRVNLSVSALSAPITVTTLPGAVVAPVSNLRVVSTAVVGGINTVTIAWDASTTPGAAYDIALNGQSNSGTNRLTAVIGESLNCYPGPCVGTGPKPGANVVSVSAYANIDGFTIFSAPVSLSFTL